MTPVRLAGGVLAVCAASALGCDRQIVVGADSLPLFDGGCVADAGNGPMLADFTVPWQTGFERNLDDWTDQGLGLCYTASGGTYPQVVTSPVHSGQHAGAFAIDTSLGPSESRCKRSGLLPAAAYYDAWYDVPAAASALDNWNLLHFQGASPTNADCVVELYDVSLADAPDGTLLASVHDFTRDRSALSTAAVPIGQWFHLQVYWQRPATGSGELRVSLDGAVIVDWTDLAPDGVAWGEWHVGDLANALSPAASTVYVDDVSVGVTPP